MTIFLSGVGTDVGKTFITRAILRQLRTQNIEALAIKPIETGSVANDANFFFEHYKTSNIKENLDINDIVPIRFDLPASPFVASKKGGIDYDLIDSKIAKLQALCDVLIIEGAGGIFTPLDEQHTMAYFAQLADETIMVVRDNLGTISDFYAYKLALKSLDISAHFLINLRNEDEFRKISSAFFDTQNVHYFPHNLKGLLKSLLGR